jgi:ribosome biogenesis GTPase
MSAAMTGRLVRGVGGLYTVRDGAGQAYVLRARGRFRREKITPLPGDLVQFTPGEGDIHGWLDEILPRVSQSLRPPVANITLEVAVIAPEPAPDLLLIDRLLVHAARSGFRTLLCVNKCDLDRDLAGRVRVQYAAAGIDVLPVSAATGEGLSALRARMTGELCCMAGQSAVGKSTLLNALLGAQLQTGGVSEKIRRGRHTTRHCELYKMGGLAVLDTPGFSLLSLDSGLEPEQLQDWYPDYRDVAAGCRFAPCVHDREPGCAVRAAVASGALDAQRHARYLALLEEVRMAWKGRFG